MRRTLITGTTLAVAAALTMVVSHALDLEMASVVLLGVAAGAVVGLVPDGSAWSRLGGFAAGFVIALVGYVVRAALLPDTDTGRAVAVLVTLLLGTVVAAATLGRLRLWAVLLGTSALAGAYEFTYAASPPELVSSAVSTATALFVTVAVGFLVVLATEPVRRPLPASYAADERLVAAPPAEPTAEPATAGTESLVPAQRDLQQPGVSRRPSSGTATPTAQPAETTKEQIQ